jgi:hypothetical protein
VKKDTISNPELELAFNFVQYTNRNIFLTGRAGTGKTTFLHTLKELSPKRMIVVAPTGVAAINAGGVTIHSFFQLPFGPKIPGTQNAEGQFANKLSNQKRNIIKSLDLLIIDEISMVRADLLDSIDEVLRKFRRSREPFGGVQLLMIGDMQQLPPVVKENEWNLLSSYYSTAFFFSSLALRKTNYVTISLQKVYRQRDEHFIEILNKIRDKQMDKQAMDLLNQRFKPNFDAGKENYIILTTHNAKAKRINDGKLDDLKVKKGKIKAKIKGNFPEYIYPTEFELELKEGAQVMFVKNDPDMEKRFFNGKIGTLIKLREDEVIVQCPEDESPINVTPIEWQNVKYAIDEKSKEIKETIDGTFTQIPLKLAWAITIHKSQGLTFEKAIIDSESAFAHGQVYVALSRCRSLEGMILSTPFSPFSLKENKSIEDFNKVVDENQPDNKVLEVSKAEFQHKLIDDLFNFDNLQFALKWFSEIIYDNKKNLQTDFSDVFEKMKPELNDKIIVVSQKFRHKIRSYLQQETNAENNSNLQERTKKASAYFTEQIKDIIEEKLKTFTIETDNKVIKKKVKNAYTKLVEEFKYKTECLISVNQGFVVKDYLTERAKASIEADGKTSGGKISKVSVSNDIINPKLYETIREWRNNKAEEQDVAHYLIVTLKSMRALSMYVPATIDQLKLIPGFGKKKLDNIGVEILELINTFAKNNDINAIPLPENTKPEKKPRVDSKLESFKLWLKHKDLEKITKERELALSTIQGHLSHYVGNGELSAMEFISENRLNNIISFLKENAELTLGEVKEKIEGEYSYFELKISRQHLDLLKTKKT